MQRSSFLRNTHDLAQEFESLSFGEITPRKKFNQIKYRKQIGDSKSNKKAKKTKKKRKTVSEFSSKNCSPVKSEFSESPADSTLQNEIKT